MFLFPLSPPLLDGANCSAIYLSRASPSPVHVPALMALGGLFAPLRGNASATANNRALSALRWASFQFTHCMPTCCCCTYVCMIGVCWSSYESCTKISSFYNSSVPLRGTCEHSLFSVFYSVSYTRMHMHILVLVVKFLVAGGVSSYPCPWYSSSSNSTIFPYWYDIYTTGAVFHLSTMRGYEIVYVQKYLFSPDATTSGARSVRIARYWSPLGFTKADIFQLVKRKRKTYQVIFFGLFAPLNISFSFLFFCPFFSSRSLFSLFFIRPFLSVSMYPSCCCCAYLMPVVSSTGTGMGIIRVFVKIRF